MDADLRSPRPPSSPRPWSASTAPPPSPDSTVRYVSTRHRILRVGRWGPAPGPAAFRARPGRNIRDVSIGLTQHSCKVIPPYAMAAPGIAQHTCELTAPYAVSVPDIVQRRPVAKQLTLCEYIA
eukprot:760341-Rhodomonas_salina.1